MTTPNTICLALDLSVAAVCLVGAILTLRGILRPGGSGRAATARERPASVRSPTPPTAPKPPTQAIRRLMLTNILTKLNRL